MSPTTVLARAADGADSAATAATGNPTISPYHTGLAGVNQPVNLMFKDMLWASLGLAAFVFLVLRSMQLLWAKFRHVSAMSASTDARSQTYWRKAQWGRMPWLKKHVLYAPLGKKRHFREFRLSSAIGLGCVPSRLQAIMLGLYLVSNLVYMFVLNWRTANQYALWAEIRGRSGTLAAVNMVPLFILAARNNPLIPWLQISYDTFNLLHRWMGRTVVVEVLIHTIAWMVVQVADGGWESVRHKAFFETFEAAGMIGTIALVMIMVFSLSPVRHAFYETFLNAHIVLAAVVLGGTWAHCFTAQVEGHKLPQLDWMIAIFLLWVLERAARLIRTFYDSYHRGEMAEALVEPMPGETCRVTVRLPRYVDVKPGTHAFLRFKEISMWECHPFSVAWVEHTPRDEDRLPVTEKNDEPTLGTEHLRTTVSFIVAARTGFTRKLYNKARASGQKATRYTVFFEGPYAGHHSLDSYGHAVLIAGATGITHQISYLTHLIKGYNDGTVATRRITLIWVVRDYEALEWVRPWMDKILRLPNRKDVLRIRLYVTRPKNPRQISSASQTVQMAPGRPNIPLLLKKEVAEQVGAMCVTVCGPGALADDVRAAVRDVQGSNVISMHQEIFSW